MLNDVFEYIEGLPVQATSRPIPLIVASAVAVGATIYWQTTPRPKTHFINPKGTFELTDKNAKDYYAVNGKKDVRQWFKEHPDEAVTLNADFGRITVLPNHMANELRNDPRLDFAELTRRMFHANLSGFEAFRAGAHNDAVKSVVMRDLTKQLSKVTEPLAEEASLAISDLLTESKEYHDIHLRDAILRLIARISSRVFIGIELCRNEDWLRITREYTVASFQAAKELRLYPWIFRPIANMYLPTCRKNRELLKEARAIIRPIIQKRAQDKAAAAERGETLKFNDAIEWFEQMHQGMVFDEAMPQLILSVAAIHTTSDLLSQTITDLALHPEMLEPLREEIVSVLKQDGWAKTSLYKMKLLDSVIKESQRLKPIATTSMSRIVKEDMTLSNGLFIGKGNVIGIDVMEGVWGTQHHTDPEKWDGYRFARMRDDPAKQHRAQLVSTTPEHLAFGHGEHACPGRFFAANEVKIALISLLLKYDFKLPEGVTPRVYEYGFSLSSDPMMKLSVRRREAEIEI